MRKKMTSFLELFEPLKFKKNQYLLGYYLGILVVAVCLAYTGRWFYYHNNVEIDQYNEEVHVDAMRVKSPEPNKRYHERYEVTRTTKAGFFPFVIREYKKKYLGIYERNR